MNRRRRGESPQVLPSLPRRKVTNGRHREPLALRPIDVHRWSDHPEVAALCDRIWDEYLPSDKTSGPKPKTAFRHQLRVLVLDLYVAWLEDPELCIGVSMSSNYWDIPLQMNSWVLLAPCSVGIFAPRCFGRRKVSEEWMFGLGLLLPK